MTGSASPPSAASRNGWRAAAAALLLAAAGPASAQLAYVGGERDRSNQQRLYVIDTAHDAVVRWVPGGYAVHSAAAGFGGRAVVYGSEKPRDVDLTILDRAGRRLSVVSVQGPPGIVALSPDRRRAYLGSETTILQSVDVARGTLVARVDLPNLAPAALAASPDGQTLAVSDGGSGGALLCNAASLKPVGRIAAANAPAGLAWAPSGKTLYLGDDDADAVAVIDIAGRRVARRIAVGRGPVALAASPDGRTLYVALRGTRKFDTPAAGGARLAVVDLAAGRVVARVPIGDRPSALALVPGAAKAYVVDDRGVEVVALGRHAVVATIAVGRDPPVAGADFIAAAR